MITKLAGLETDSDIKYKTREEQVLLLQQVMAATDAEVGEEEMVPGAGKLIVPSIAAFSLIWYRIKLIIRRTFTVKCIIIFP